MTANMSTNKQPKGSHTNEAGEQICNYCCNPADKPFRYRTHSGETRGCIGPFHDSHVVRNTKPDWCKPRNVLPRWITQARRAMRAQQDQIDYANGLQSARD